MPERVVKAAHIKIVVVPCGVAVCVLCFTNEHVICPKNQDHHFLIMGVFGGFAAIPSLLFFKFEENISLPFSESFRLPIFCKPSCHQILVFSSPLFPVSFIPFSYFPCVFFIYF